MSTWHRKSREAEKYNIGMWQRMVSEMVMLAWASGAQRQGFRDGFNGQPKPHHHAVRANFDRGRHAAILLGCIENPAP